MQKFLSQYMYNFNVFPSIQFGLSRNHSFLCISPPFFLHKKLMNYNILLLDDLDKGFTSR